MSGESIVARFRDRLRPDDQQIWDQLMASRDDWGNPEEWDAITATNLMPALRTGGGQNPKEVAVIEDAFSFFEREVPPVSPPPLQDSMAVRFQRPVSNTLGSMPPRFSTVEDYIRYYQGNPTRAIRRILITNNGMAAVKGIRSFRQWAYDNLGDDHAIEIVVMATTEDLKANASFIGMADRYIEVSGGPNNNNYANVGLIVRMAKEQQVDAVWPGWGHASENPALPRELIKAGIIFMGPEEKPMMALGDKIGANLVAQSKGVSMIPWSGDGLMIDYATQGIPREVYSQATVRNAEEAEAQANRIGYPVMIKASGTGGGRGMRKVQGPEGLKSAFSQVMGESAGSPIFVMKLASARSRHIEIQVAADAHGNAVALYERDCSVQRRHQKIIEEGPAIGAPEEIRRRMRDQAVALAKEVGYQGMGTVEFMYDPETREFYFLELNSRLQVEHPVTEGITGINLPGVQLAISMGIPLHRIPEIRKFFGKDPASDEEIDFSTIHDLSPKGHVIAVRITAENADEGFKLTAGLVQDIRFEPPPHVWGYFSVGPRSEVHTLADSQIGHIFAQGETREEARRRAVMALKNLTIRGEIRTNREMLITLLESEEFKFNHVDTSWLDGLITAKKTAEKPDTLIALMAGAIYKAYIGADETVAQYVSQLQSGHIPPRKALKTSFDVELIYDNVKYPFVVTRTGLNRFVITLKGERVEGQIRKQADGGYLLIFNGMAHLVYVQEEVNGLRLEIDGNTCLFTKEYDPTQIKADMPGKLIRPLVPDGSKVSKNEPIAVIEAMKMEQEIRAPEAGVIHYALQAGRDFPVGGLIATLELGEGVEVQKAVEIDRPVGLTDEEEEEGLSVLGLFQSVHHGVLGILDGYGYPEDDFKKALGSIVNDLWTTLYSPRLPVEAVSVVMESLQGRLPQRVEEAVWEALIYYGSVLEGEGGGPSAGFPSDNILSVIQSEREALSNQEEQTAFDNAVRPLDETVARHATTEKWVVSILKEYLNHYLNIEKRFQGGKKYDEVVRELREEKDNLGGWDKVYEVVRSHSNLAHKNQLILELLDHISTSRSVDRFLSELDGLSSLEGEDYSDVAAKAKLLLVRQRLQTYENRSEELGSKLRLASSAGRDTHRKTIRELVAGPEAMFDILFPYFSDEGSSVRAAAMRVYVKRAYRLYPIQNLEINEESGFLKATWSYGYLRDSHERPARQGVMAYFKSLEDLEGNLPRLIRLYDEAISNPELDNSLTIAVKEPPISDEGRLIAHLGGMLTPYHDALQRAGAGRVTFVVGHTRQFPSYYTFRRETGYQEDVNVRHIEPPLAFQLEMRRLEKFDYRYSPSENRQIHVYHAVQKSDPSEGVKASDLDRRLFARAVVRGATVTQNLAEADRHLEVPEVEHSFVSALDELELALRSNGNGVNKTELNHIYLNILPGLVLEESVVQDYMGRLARRYASRLKELKVNEVEVRLVLNSGGDKQTLRYFLTNPTGSFLHIDGYRETKDEKGRYVLKSLRANDPGMREGKEVDSPYEPLNPLERKRVLARSKGTSYVYDFPILLENSLRTVWNRHATSRSITAPYVPVRVMEKRELVLSRGGELVEVERPDGRNNIGMVAWRLTLVTPEAPEGRDIILIANDITHQNGSFSVQEDQLYQKASELARREGIPRIFIAANSGARIGMADEIKSLYRVAETGEGDQTKLDYFYLTPDDYEAHKSSVIAERIEEGEEIRYKIIAVIGKKDGINQENLRGSGLIAGETSAAYDETFTLTYVSGVNVGIGSYVTRLGQRVIQRNGADIILTGYEALNALLKQNVYQSNRELGGTPIMFPNGMTHRVVQDDLEGMGEIIRWLGYVPLRKGGELPRLDHADPVGRDVDFAPFGGPYDPRQFIEGATYSNDRWVSGFFDKGSFTETLAGWGKTVVTGRARLGGIPTGVIAFDTRLVERKIPADPGDRTSAERIEKQAGQVWYPDSSYKTAQTIADFDREGLPLMIFINVRGFSGGTRDMYFEVLKYGSYIVDNLRHYKQPIFIYLPPHAELRGGSWVVVDPMINPDQIRFYADPTARGGVLEPSGLRKIKYRDPELIRTMHRLDEQLINFDQALLQQGLSDQEVKSLKSSIRRREADLLPYYQSVAEAFADLHDKPERMEAKGVIDGIVPWKESRRFFHHQLQRRLAEDRIVRGVIEADSRLTGMGKPVSYALALERLHSLYPAEIRNASRATVDEMMANDRAILEWLEQNNTQVQELIKGTRTVAAEAIMAGLRESLGHNTFNDIASRLLVASDPNSGGDSGSPATGEGEDNSGTPRNSADRFIGGARFIAPEEGIAPETRTDHNARVWEEAQGGIRFADYDDGAALKVQPDPAESEEFPPWASLGDPAEIIPVDTAANDGVYNLDEDHDSRSTIHDQRTTNSPWHLRGAPAGVVGRSFQTKTGRMLRVIGR